MKPTPYNELPDDQKPKDGEFWWVEYCGVLTVGASEVSRFTNEVIVVLIGHYEAVLAKEVLWLSKIEVPSL